MFIRTRFSRLLLTVATVSMMATLAGCQSTPKSEHRPLFFPAPPAQPRIQFLTWANGASEVEPGQTAFDEFILGEEPALRRRIDKPYGIAARDGVVYVCDTKGLCLCRLDFKNQTYSVLGTRGPGRLRKPINIAIDSLGYKFVVDPVRQQVVVFDPEDMYVRAFDIPKPCRPVDVATYENEVYVLDNDETCQIVVLDRSSGEVLRTMGGPGGERGQFKLPNSLCVGPDGYLYVTDTHNYRIQKLTRNGEPVWAKGMPGYGLGQFGRPRGLRAGPDGMLYVADAATEIVQMINAEGEVKMYFGGPGNVPGSMVLPATLAADTTSLPYFKQYVHADFEPEYLLFVTNQYGPHLVSIYAFGSFPEGYELSESEIRSLPRVSPEGGKTIGPVPETEEPPTSQPQTQEEET